MLNFKKGRPLAIVEGGKYNKKIIYLYDKKICCENCNEECKYNKCCDDCNYDDEPEKIKGNLLDIVNEDYIRSFKKKMPVKDIVTLQRSFIKNTIPSDEELRDIYDKIVEDTDKICRKTFKIHDNGVIRLLPNFNEDSERSYVAGATGSGKSYFVKKYIQSYQKVYPRSKIYIFSDVENDPELDNELKNIERIPLNEDLLEPELDMLNEQNYKNSIVLFDDIDSISNKHLKEAVYKFNDKLMTRGRHENISTILTSHLLTNYKETRITLNSVSNITFFPGSGSTHAIKYLLSKYIGLSNDIINRIFKLKSRAVTIIKRYPITVISDKEIFII